MTATEQRNGAEAPAAEEPARSVAEALRRVMRDLPGIAKERHQADGQGGINYAYRGIEQITREAQGLFARHGVVWAPEVLSWEVVDITVANKPWTDTRLLVRYHVHLASEAPGLLGGAASDELLVGPLLAIGRDNSDKGANKAMTQAFKYALIQTLCIADPKDDGDQQSQEADSRGAPEEEPAYAAPEQLEALRERMEAAKGAMDPGVLAAAWQEAKLPPGKAIGEMLSGNRQFAQAATVARAHETLDRLEAEQAASTPCSLCGSTRAQRVLVEGAWRCSDARGCADRDARRAAQDAAAEGGSQRLCEIAGCDAPCADGEPFCAEHKPF